MEAKRPEYARSEYRWLLLMLGVVTVGIVGVLAGLLWDAGMHARDHELASREGVFTLANAAHALFLTGLTVICLGVAGGLAGAFGGRRRTARAPAPIAPAAAVRGLAPPARAPRRARGRAALLVLALLGATGVLGSSSHSPASLASPPADGTGDAGGVAADTAGPLRAALQRAAADPVGEQITPVAAPLKFTLTDQAGTWFDGGIDVAGTRSLLVATASPTALPLTFQIGAPATNAGHTITSLIWPTGAKGMPFDQGGAFVGETKVTLETPGLYAFMCKVHPYMLGAVVVDDPTTPGLDFGKMSSIPTGQSMPSASDLILRLVHTFFVATAPSNWQTYSPTSSTTWDPQYPTAPILAYGPGEKPVLIPNLNTFFHDYFKEPKTLPALNTKPATPGVGEVWIDTQFEGTAGKDKPGTATAVDVSTWQVSKKAALPSVNMDNPHNMWTDRDHNVIYQTEWFSNKLDVFDRESLKLIRQLDVGPSPSHVMTRTDTDQLHVALNGGNAVVEVAPGATKIDRRLLTQAPGEKIAHPHAHWMSADAKFMVTPNPNTNDATLFNVPAGSIASKPKLESIPIASSMTPDGSKYYIANLLSNSISCVSISAPACVADGKKVAMKTIRLDANYDPVSGATSGPFGLLPIQTPVSPDGKYMLTANTTSGTVTVYNVATDTVVKNLPCDPGCHGLNFGAKKGGGYYAYLSNKFSNAMQVIDGDPNGDGDPSDAAVVGKMVLDAGPSTRTDDTVTRLSGMGGQGVLALPLVYNGWVQTVPNRAPFDQLTCAQRNPIQVSACSASSPTGAALRRRGIGPRAD